MELQLSGRMVHKYLNGFLCAYKNAGVSLSALKGRIVSRIVAAGNQLEIDRVPEIERDVVAPTTSGSLVVVGRRKQLDYSLHPLVNGMPFNKLDILLDEMEPMEAQSSGICVFAVNGGADRLESVRDLAWTSEYIINGKLGEQSYENALKSRIITRASCGHVSKAGIEKILSGIRHEYRQLSYKYSSVDMHSQEAFELLRRGIIRPKVLGSPIIADIQLVRLNVPYFTLKILSMSENEHFLRTLISEIGCLLNTVARPVGCRRTRVGPFLPEHALLERHLQLPSILQNIQMSNYLIEETEKTHRNSNALHQADATALLAHRDRFHLNYADLEKDFSEALNFEEITDDAFVLPWGREYTKVSK